MTSSDEPKMERQNKKRTSLPPYPPLIEHKPEPGPTPPIQPPEREYQDSVISINTQIEGQMPWREIIEEVKNNGEISPTEDKAKVKIAEKKHLSGE